jgi:hypothetical protein
MFELLRKRLPFSAGYVLPKRDERLDFRFNEQPNTSFARMEISAATIEAAASVHTHAFGIRDQANQR